VILAWLVWRSTPVSKHQPTHRETIMMIRKILTAAAVVAAVASPFAANAGTFKGPVNALTLNYKAGLNESSNPDTVNQFSLSVQGVTGGTCTTVFAPATASLDDIKLFIEVFAAAKSSGKSMHFTYDTSCSFSFFGFAPN
jgi:hypothetical protein